MADLGKKYTCYSCHTKFYDLGKPEPICPKCGADQRDAEDTPVVAPTRGRSRAAAPPPPPVVEEAEDDFAPEGEAAPAGASDEDEDIVPEPDREEPEEDEDEEEEY